MVKYNRVDCLAHPVCVTFLKQKWFVATDFIKIGHAYEMRASRNAFGSLVYNLRVGIYMLFLGLLTSVALDIDSSVMVVPNSPSLAKPGYALELTANYSQNPYVETTVPCHLESGLVSQLRNHVMVT